jgi:hypothetical protein
MRRISFKRAVEEIGTVTTHVWNWGNRQKIEIDDNGHIDANAERAFTNGQCHALAIAIHDLTGWQLIALCQADPDDFEDRYDVLDNSGHVVVRTPRGDYLNIRGKDVLDRWSDSKPVEITRDEACDMPRYMKPDLNAARVFAPVVLRKFTGWRGNRLNALQKGSGQ